MLKCAHHLDTKYKINNMAYKHLNNIKDLKEFLNNFPDETPLFHYHHDMERSGYETGLCLPNELTTLYEDKQLCCDAFDGTEYTYHCYSKIKGKDNAKQIQGLII